MILGLGPTSFPIFGCTLLVSPFITVPTTTSLPLSIPMTCDPGAINFSFFVQWAVLDAGAVPNIALSNGLQVTL